MLRIPTLFCVWLLLFSSPCLCRVTDEDFSTLPSQSFEKSSLDFSILPNAISQSFEKILNKDMSTSVAVKSWTQSFTSCIDLAKNKDDWTDLFDSVKSKAIDFLPKAPFCIDECRRVTTILDRNGFCLLGIGIHNVKITSLDLKSLMPYFRLIIKGPQSVWVRIPVNAGVSALADWDCGIFKGTVQVTISARFYVDFFSAACIPSSLEDEDLEKMLRASRLSPQRVAIDPFLLDVTLSSNNKDPIIYAIVKGQEGNVRQRLIDMMKSDDTAEKVLDQVKRLLVEKGIQPV